MRVGTIVEIVPHEGDLPIPAIVLKDWEEESGEPHVSLFTFQFETVGYQRVWPKSGLKVVGNQEELEGRINDRLLAQAGLIAGLLDRVAGIENILMEMATEPKTKKNHA